MNDTTTHEDTTMTVRRIYTVGISHPTNFHSGKHQVTVTECHGKTGVVYCDARGFGCSRDYCVCLPWEKKTVKEQDASAIRQFMGEHGCRVVSIKKS